MPDGAKEPVQCHADIVVVIDNRKRH